MLIFHTIAYYLATSPNLDYLNILKKSELSSNKFYFLRTMSESKIIPLTVEPFLL